MHRQGRELAQETWPGLICARRKRSQWLTGHDPVCLCRVSRKGWSQRPGIFAAGIATGICTLSGRDTHWAAFPHLDPNSDAVWMKPGVHMEHQIRKPRLAVGKEGEGRTVKCRRSKEFTPPKGALPHWLHYQSLNGGFASLS